MRSGAVGLGDVTWRMAATILAGIVAFVYALVRWRH